MQEVANLQDKLDIRFPITFNDALIHYERGEWSESIVYFFIL